MFEQPANFRAALVELGLQMRQSVGLGPQRVAILRRDLQLALEILDVRLQRPGLGLAGFDCRVEFALDLRERFSSRLLRRQVTIGQLLKLGIAVGQQGAEPADFREVFTGRTRDGLMVLADFVQRSLQRGVLGSLFESVDFGSRSFVAAAVSLFGQSSVELLNLIVRSLECLLQRIPFEAEPPEGLPGIREVLLGNFLRLDLQSDLRFEFALTKRGGCTLVRCELFDELTRGLGIGKPPFECRPGLGGLREHRPEL